MSIGEVAEWSKALVLKTSNGVTRSWVRIPPSPPFLNYLLSSLFTQASYTKKIDRVIKPIYKKKYIDSSEVFKNAYEKTIITIKLITIGIKIL